MMGVRSVFLAGLFLCLQPGVMIFAAQQGARASKATANKASFAFEPLDRWKAAVVSGDKAALATLYSTSPAAQTKTPKGETQDPAEEPSFWSSLKPAGLTRFDLKVLEAKDVQPGVKAFVLRYEVKLHTPTGEKSGVISGSQVWMQKVGDWRIVSTQRSDIAENAPRRLPEPAKPNVQLYPDPEEAPVEIATALAAAAKDHKRVLLVFGGNWCYDCHVLDTTFHSKQIAPLITQNYHVIHINVGNYDKNLDLAKKYEIPLEKGVPSLAVLDPDGKLVVSQKKGEFESTTRIGPEDVVDFLKRWKPQHGA
jgi:thioredoxin 1